MAKFLTDTDNAAALAADIKPEDREEYARFGHNRLESAFVDRVLVLYECQGKNSKDVQRPPKILTTIRVIDFKADYAEGICTRLLDESTQEAMNVDYVPKRLFKYPIFVSIPPRLTVKWDAQFMGDKLVRSLLFAILIKSANRSDFYSKGNVYLETPNRVRALYPHVELDFSF